MNLLGGIDWQAVALSARLAAATTVILIVVSVPLAAWLATTRRRWAVGVEAVVALPLVLPPTVLGYYLLVAMGNRSPVGRLWFDLTGSTLVFSFSGLLVASVLYSLPFAVQPLMTAYAGVDPRLLDAARTLGRSWVEVVVLVLLPLGRAGLATAAVLTFAHTVGEFGVVLMVGGSIPGETRTVAVSVYDSVQAFDYATAGRTSLLLLVLSFAVLVATYALQKPRRNPGQPPGQRPNGRGHRLPVGVRVGA